MTLDARVSDLAHAVDRPDLVRIDQIIRDGPRAGRYISSTLGIYYTRFGARSVRQYEVDVGTLGAGWKRGRQLF